ncbi:dethiobiotin synthase [Shewanella denitrificans OS217]|uniref:ATP-dependent dethiobiotin synthetase BioD n=1 Tax=Shewanella denitrificans (strain OS217 / ATCC BAA-1090 / DSM 15013) TaxID=318161 RepID=Q12NN1_SHEDO|nr:dethiobiotin synthase [Shewanella denitrificans]ABE54945.1 dethiobiotin synthase [Shewanella denitrificans OS217]
MVFFVTGTDTDSGKTLVSATLLSLARGQKTGVKPLASGCMQTANGLRNSDALQLMAHSNMGLSYQRVNPIAFEAAIAPHIAAKRAGFSLTLDAIDAAMPWTQLYTADFALIEGAGGWRLPLGDGHYLSELVQRWNTRLQERHRQLGVILVVGMKLGCLNHALLTQEAIVNDGLTIVGWVANQVDKDMACIEDNLDSLKQMMLGEFLGYVPFLPEPSPQAAGNYISVECLIS